MDNQEQLKSNLKNERHHNLEETRYWCDQYKMLAIKMEAELAALKAENAELVAALELYFRAGAGNSTDFKKQADARKKADAAIAKHRGE